MANWSVSIVVTDRVAKRVRATGVRTDGEDERSYSVDSEVDTANLSASRQKVVDGLWAAYQAEITCELEEATLIAGWETALEGDLNGLET